MCSPEVPEGIGLTLCGHTHGGQVKVPGVGPLVTSSKFGTRFAEGWVTAPAQGFVSRGLGFSILPVRLNCRAEVVGYRPRARLTTLPFERLLTLPVLLYQAHVSC